MNKSLNYYKAFDKVLMSMASAQNEIKRCNEDL